jgi:hypothetical protein
VRAQGEKRSEARACGGRIEVRSRCSGSTFIEWGGGDTGALAINGHRGRRP